MSAKFNILSSDPACTDCIKSYSKKHNLNRGDSFSIVCSGIPKEYISPSVAESVPEEELKSMVSMLDPVTWAAEVLDWHCIDPDGAIWKRKTAEGTLGEVTPYIEEEFGEKVKLGKSAFNRPYQSTMLRCSSRRKVFRIGRQCVDGSTVVTMQDGSTKLITDIKIGDEVITIDDKTYKQDTAFVLDAFPSGIKSRYKVHTLQGHEVIVSEDHPFLVKEGKVDEKHKLHIEDLSSRWLTIKDGLAIKNRIAIYTGINSNTVNVDNKLYSDEHLRILGYFLTDGSYGKNQSAKFTNNNQLYIDEFTKDCGVLGSKTKLYKKGNGQDVIITNGRLSKINKNNPVADWLRSLGCYGLTFEQRELPDFVFSLSRRQVGLFLNRAWAGDGWVEITTRKERNTRRCSLGIASNSIKYLDKLKALLIKFGISSFVRREAITSYSGNRPFFKLHISRSSSIIKFFDLVGQILGKESQSILGLEIAKESIKKDRVKTENDITWDFIKSITKLEDGPVYDISLDHKHTFIANSSILLKNCGKTESLCIAILHGAFTHKEFRVLVITPYQSQIELIFTRLSQMMKSSTTATNSMKRYVKAPNYTIELHNGSTIRGFTAGTKSGGNADAVRGQKANMLVLDEADYLSSEDLGSVLSVITNYPDATVWMSSTPSGKREKFFDACKNKTWKEYHYPSYVNPLWSDYQESMFRDQFTEIEYKHEVEADFGDQEQGVYQTKYIDGALVDYKYSEQIREPDWQYCIGVDWNDIKIGTTIAIVGFNPENSTFRLMERHVVSRESWTQTAACNEIVRLNAYWRPNWIYIDKGFGTTQDEILRKFGWDSLANPNKGRNHPDSRLARIVKTYDFGSKVTTKDLFTRQDREKAAKPFLVENSVRRFEQFQIQVSKYDTQLEAELRGYIIDHVTSTGLPVYKAGNEKAGDHNLDALNLALIAFTLEMSDFGKVTYDTKIAFAGQLGERLPTSPSDKAKAFNDKEKRKPSNRTNFIETKPGLFKQENKQPSAHTKSQTGQRLWSWPGFERDAPRPQPNRSSSLGGRRHSPPKRKNI